MARGKCTFRQQDVTRALKGTIAAGLPVQRVEIGNDNIAIIIGAPGHVTDEEISMPNEWEGAE